MLVLIRWADLVPGSPPGVLDRAPRRTERVNAKIDFGPVR